MVRKILLFFWVCIFCIQVYSGESFRVFLEEHKGMVKYIESLQAEFIQTETLGDAGMQREKKGRLWARADGCFRVEYSLPESILMIFDLNYFIQHFVADDDLQVISAEEMDKKTNPFYLWFNIDTLEEYYTVSDVADKDGCTIVSISDSSNNSLIKSIDLYISKSSGLLLKIDSLGQDSGTRTVLEFTDYKINTSSEDLFIIPAELLDKKPSSPSAFYE